MHPSVDSVVAAPRASGATGFVRVLEESARTAAEAAAAHAHADFPTSYDELLRLTGGQPAQVAG